MATQSMQTEEEKKKMEKIKKELRTSVMKGEWDNVLQTFKDHQEAEVRGVGITLSNDTALHMAVYENKKKIVESLVEMIDPETNVMQLADNKGNTPLHLAAKLGSEAMCKCIAWKKHGLIGCRNKEGETPMFLAALHGKKDAFVLLYSIYCFQERIYSYEDLRTYTCGRRTDGWTVLHCAIDGEYFDLAFQIINRFPNFHHCVDERGHTPLHLLASKHSAFSSSCHLTSLQKIIYACTSVGNPRITMDYKYPDSGNSTSGQPRDVENPPPCAKQCSIFSTAIKGWLKSAVVLLISGVSRTRDLFPKQIAEVKEKHMLSVQIMWLLLRNASYYDYTNTGREPTSLHHVIDVDGISHEITNQNNKNESPILIAAKYGIKEIVEDILRYFPVAIHDVNSEGKNLVMLAVENRQPHVYKLLLEREHTKNNLLYQVDNEGNSALHLAANLKDDSPWLAPNAVIQMQWEIKWYEYIKEKMPGHLLVFQNKKGKTPEALFMETHRDLVRNDTKWLMKTSDSCTIVATLIATVAFATSASVPGGVSGRNGEPILIQQRMFEMFAISSLVALCFSLTAAVMFLSILTSRHQAMDFGTDLPRKLLIGLTALFLSIASVLVSFCGGHFFVLRHILRDARVVEYLVVCVPVAIFAIMQCPLYFKLILATIKKEPKRGYMLAT